MIIRAIGHPVERMALRGITIGDVESVLLGFHTSMPGRKGSCCYIGSVGGRNLKVWLLRPMTGEESDNAEVVMKSAAWRDEEDDD